ncbi:PAS domain S-box protein [candidate division FCPU426 bacterium]|nr:PAS domain S-box protein [candidate division FCPU426 bacterium]
MALPTAKPLWKLISKNRNRQEENLLSTTLRCMEEGIITTDSKGKIVLLNRAAKKLTGWPLEESFGRILPDIFNLIHAKSRKPCKNPFEKVMETGKTVQLPKRTILRSKDGSERYIGGNLTPLRDALANIIGIVLVFSDITENVHAEEELEKQAHDLGERVKELDCLYSISALVEKHGFSLDKIYHKIVYLLPSALRWPDATCARVTIGDKSFYSDSFQETPWAFMSTIAVNQSIIGRLEVFLSHFSPEEKEAPFLEEEQNLIRAVCERLANITEIKQAEETLNHRVQLESLIAKISTRFININPRDIEAVIRSTLRAVGEYMHVDRCYLLQLAEDRKTFTCSYEWCAPDVEPQKEQCLNKVVDCNSPLMARLFKQEPIHIPCIEALPPEACQERECMQQQSIRSMLAVPLVRTCGVTGILGFDSVKSLRRWLDEDIVFLETLSNIFSNALERRQIDLALQESEQRVELAIQGADLGLWDWDYARREIYFDPRGSEILGFPHIEIKQHLDSIRRLLAPEETASLAGIWEKHIKGKTPYLTAEIRIQTPGGKQKWVLMCGKLIARDGQGKPIRATGTLLDITDRKQAEEEKNFLEKKLLQSQRLESLGRLTGGIAHDFNNILSPILCYTDLCLESLPADSPLHEYLEQVAHATQRAKELTHQLLAFGRNQVLDIKGISLAEQMLHFEKMIRRTLREDIEIEIHNDPDLGLVKADPVQIGQVLLNLTLNAQDAMPNGGKLDISNSNVYIDEETAPQCEDIQPGSYIKIVVSDTGLGMSQETMSHIFEPFFTTKDPSKGTGLGLATVHGIVKQHGGFISVCSEPKLGSIFKIYLPRAENKNEKPPEDAMPDIKLTGRETVLVVEDEKQVRNLMSQILNKYGYKVYTAANAEEAVELVKQERQPLDLLITDVIMPRINGKELFQQLTVRHPGLKVLFVSGYAKKIIENRINIEPGLNFLQKPFSVEELARKTRILLDCPSA